MAETQVQNIITVLTIFLSTLFLPLVCEALGSGYTLTSITEAPDGKSLTAQLKLNAKISLYGQDIQLLDLLVRYESNDRLRVHITDGEKKRWEVPSEVVGRYDGGGGNKNNTNKPELQFSYTPNPFGFAVTRTSNGEVLFNSTPHDQGQNRYPFGNMVFKDQYLEISTALPATASLYGLGESTRPGFRLDRNGSQYTLWNLDIGSVNLYLDLYGSHPFYIDMRAESFTHGVLLLNSNGMDVEYGRSYLTYRVIGGVLDFYFFSGPSPLDVVQQYTDLVGRPAPMPYWSFGFHQCRYGYKNISDVKSVVAGYAEAKIPLETIWTDIDYMDGFKDFTLDTVNYPEKEMREFIEQIHTNGQKYVLIIDPGISINETYKTFQRGIQDDIFVKRGGAPYLAQAWPGPVYFPDFLNPKTLSFWTNEISEFHNTIPFDGLWLDMNEVSNFCSGITCSLPKDGNCPRKNAQTECCLVCSDANATKWDDPPYKINSAGIHRPLGNKTMATSAVHYNDTLEYDAHNLYGLSEVIVTNKALKSALNKRPFILTRSTFIGSGVHAAHWTGDNAASWDDLWYSIPTMLSFGLFGVPMVGADICGFARDTTEELCNRWIQLGSFYPFARDHSDKGTIRQELYLWKSVTQSARKALGLRYRLLPYIYTLSFEAHTKGYPMARPLFFTFPKDANTLGISTQFLLGRTILVSPVLKEGATTVDAYFPKGTWYNLFNVSDSITVENGSYVKLQAPLDTINVHVHEGTILPMQEMGMTTSECRRSPFSLVVAFGSRVEANGELYLDNGEDLEMKLASGRSSYVEFFANVVEAGVSLRSAVQMGAYAIKEGWILQRVTVLGLNSFSGYSSTNASFHSDDGNEHLKLRAVVDGKCVGVFPSFSVESVRTNLSSHIDHYDTLGFHVVVSNLSLPIGKNFEIMISWK